jgi:co-chaperonin GroES (HSP10)
MSKSYNWKLTPICPFIRKTIVAVPSVEVGKLLISISKINYLWSMEITGENKLRKIIVVGVRVLIKPKKMSERTESGLYLPAGVREKERVQSGYIMKTGPGYPIPMPVEEDEPWKDQEDQVKYVPLQAKKGDLALFLQKGAFEILYEGEKYFIVPQSSILMLEREEDLN